MHNFAQPAAQHDELVRLRRRRRPTTRTRPTSGRRGSNPSTGAAVHRSTTRRSRNAWGVDLNRNNTFATLFDGYIGASYSCISDVVRRPVRGLRAGDQERALDRGHVQEHQVLEQHPQLRRLLHVGAGRVPAGPRRGRRGPREHRRREVLLRGRRPDPQPDQGGPRTRRSSRSARARSRTSSTPRPATAPTSTGTTAASSRTAFETGRRSLRRSTRPCSIAGRRPGRRGSGLADRNRLHSRATRSTIDPGTAHAGDRGRSQSVTANNPPSPAPNVILTASRSSSRTRRTAMLRGRDPRRSGSASSRPYATEGKFEALEFAAGNYGLLESATSP